MLQYSFSYTFSLNFFFLSKRSLQTTNTSIFLTHRSWTTKDWRRRSGRQPPTSPSPRALASAMLWRRLRIALVRSSSACRARWATPCYGSPPGPCTSCYPASYSRRPCRRDTSTCCTKPTSRTYRSSLCRCTGVILITLWLVSSRWRIISGARWWLPVIIWGFRSLRKWRGVGSGSRDCTQICNVFSCKWWYFSIYLINSV